MVYLNLFYPLFSKTRTRFIANGELETSDTKPIDDASHSGSIHDCGEKAKAILDLYPRAPSFIFIPTINRHVEHQNARKEMEVKSVSLDRISNLPQDIIALILSLLSTRDALLRTSVLSRKWRFRWAYTDSLSFDEMIFEESLYRNLIMMCNAIFHILVLHKGPLLELSLCVELEMVSHIDLIFHYLSRTKTLKGLELLNRSPKRYKLPFSFFLLQGLDVLELTNCVFEPPFTFKGFRELTGLRLENVKITPKILKCFLTNCPLLENFYLARKKKDTTKANKFTLAELFECLPSIVTLVISQSYMKYFGSGGIPHKLPIPPIHLKALYLGVCFMEQEELLSTLCLIKSSPNLEKIYLRVSNEPLHYSQPTSVDFMGIEDHSSFKFDHLVELWMINFSNLPIEMEFVKLVMSKSPVLKKVIIELHDKIPIVEKLKMYTHQLQFPFPRPSSSTELIFRRSNTEESLILSS